MAYWERFRGRWQTISYAARYGGQTIDGILGRPPTFFELQIFCTFISDYVEIEKNDQAALFRIGGSPSDDEEGS